MEATACGGFTRGDAKSERKRDLLTGRCEYDFTIIKHSINICKKSIKRGGKGGREWEGYKSPRGSQTQ